MKCRPILRWAGGKKRIVEKLMSALPANFGTYYEPMLGGGALFFELQPSNVVLSDINDELMNFYTVLRDQRDRFIEDLLNMVPSKSKYYRVREEEPSDAYSRAVRFAYLNRLCWNGLYRVNREGKFNVPFGDRLPKVMWEPEHLIRASEALAKAKLVTSDFENALSDVMEGDLVFFDPPYPRGSSDGNGFDRYSIDGFGIEDHNRIGRLIEALRKNGVTVIVVLANKPELLNIYPNGITHANIFQKSLISADPSSRRTVPEVVLKYVA